MSIYINSKCKLRTYVPPTGLDVLLWTAEAIHIIWERVALELWKPWFVPKHKGAYPPAGVKNTVTKAEWKQIHRVTILQGMEVKCQFYGFSCSVFLEVINVLLSLCGAAGATWVWDGKESLSHGKGQESWEAQWEESRVRRYWGGRWGQGESTTKF